MGVFRGLQKSSPPSPSTGQNLPWTCQCSFSPSPFLLTKVGHISSSLRQVFLAYYIICISRSSSIKVRYGLVARICRSHSRVSSLLQRSAGKARVRFPVSETFLFLFCAYFWVRKWVGISFCWANRCAGMTWKLWKANYASDRL